MKIYKITNILTNQEHFFLKLAKAHTLIGTKPMSIRNKFSKNKTNKIIYKHFTIERITVTV